MIDAPLPEVRQAYVMSEAALSLIAGSEAEVASIYAPEHRYAFSPDELVAAKVHFVVAWEGRPRRLRRLRALRGIRGTEAHVHPARGPGVGGWRPP